MELEHSFTVPRGVDDVWDVLLDIERVAPCLPGATVTTVDGDDLTGEVKVKLGPVSLKYAGQARVVEKDHAAHRAVIEGSGRDARGNGAASARIVAAVTGDDRTAQVSVRTDLDITGKAAQFGRGVIGEVSARLMGQFADALAVELGPAGGGAPVAVAAAPQGGSADLLRLVAPSLARRAAPALLGLAGAVGVVLVVRRRRRTMMAG
ncbi:carbon monoxide dehydrogenase [Pimelobacter simplex]|uniref:Carbon monoxide dehydrogenase n=1 Tax=Nocardioides simplex TaxID=2045 RepID=A0A7J5E425_NOCSI|nr:SRPBCC family protein [Pimelobacter simplex]KAB2812923.1 carbon monoxide dehydrogenase [Pimelobacter simplex]